MNNNKSTFIIISGIIILSVFAYVSAYNLLPENITSDSYYSKTEEDIIAKIEKIDVNDGILTVTTSGQLSAICVKSTKSPPKISSICWQNTSDNYHTFPVLQGKKYYIWIKDINNKISSYETIK